MTARLPYTRWHRDRGGKLRLITGTYQLVGEAPSDQHTAEQSAADKRVERICECIGAALLLGVGALVISAATGCAAAADDQSMGRASEDSYDSSPESASPEAQSTFSGRGWCCDAFDADSSRYLECGLSAWPEGHADEAGNRCYCHGIVDGSECRDNTAWTPGTFCTQAELVCREE